MKMDEVIFVDVCNDEFNFVYMSSYYDFFVLLFFFDGDYVIYGIYFYFVYKWGNFSEDEFLDMLFVFWCVWGFVCFFE